MRTLIELLDDMRKGAKVCHYDWPEGEWITIKNGEFITESGAEFTLSPYQLTDDQFFIDKNAGE